MHWAGIIIKKVFLMKRITILKSIKIGSVVRLLAVVAGPRERGEGDEEPARRPRRRGDGDRPERFRRLGRARRPGSSGGRLDDAREAVLADEHDREGRGVEEHGFLRLAETACTLGKKSSFWPDGARRSRGLFAEVRAALVQTSKVLVTKRPQDASPAEIFTCTVWPVR